MSRWSAPEEPDEVLAKFKNALVNGLDSWFGRQQHYDETLEQRFSIVHGSSLGQASGIRHVLRSASSREEVALTLEHLLQAAAQTPLEYGATTKNVDAVAKAIHDAIEHHRGIRLRLVNTGEDKFEIYPAGVDEIDESAVDQTVAWLATFPAVQAEAQKALRAHVEGDFATSLNSSRQTLEMLVRAALGNAKSLENQIGADSSSDAPLLRWMRERGSKPQTVTLAQRVVSSFCDLQNSWVKHVPASGASFDEPEAEYALYAAFIVARFITRLAENQGRRTALTS
jgi:hypothetical protein